MNTDLNFVGDLLLAFSAHKQQFPARVPGSPWKIDAQDLDWCLWKQKSRQSWKGFPCQIIKIPVGQLWMLGEYYPPSPTFSNLKAVLADIETLDQQIAALNGRSLIWFWDEIHQRWHLWTDRFGTIHAYYAVNSVGAAVGTFFPSVAAIASKRGLDWPGLAGFFAFGFFPNDRTWFEDVRILRPATHYTFSDTGHLIGEERYWHWWHEPDSERSYEDTVEEFAGIFEGVMADHLAGGRVAIPISGGLDSRSTVAPIRNPTPPNASCWSYSYGYAEDSVETHLARQVAAARRFPFQSFTIQPYLFDRIEQIMAWTEGFQDITQPRQAFVVDEIAVNADYLIGALWGDVWHDEMGYPGEGQEDVVRFTLHKMAKGGRQWLLDKIVSPKLGEKTLNRCLYEMVKTEIYPLENIEDPDFRIKAYKTEQWSFRWSIPPIRVFQSATWPRLVFYDTRLTDFFCSVPTAYVSQRRMQIDYLKRYAPDLAGIKWQVYDADLYRYQHFHTWQLPRRAIKKAWRVLQGRNVIERNWEVQFLNENGRQDLGKWLLGNGLRLHEFVSPVAIENLLDAFYQSPHQDNAGYTVSMLLTFSTWLDING